MSTHLSTLIVCIPLKKPLYLPAKRKHTENIPPSACARSLRHPPSQRPNTKRAPSPTGNVGRPSSQGPHRDVPQHHARPRLAPPQLQPGTKPKKQTGEIPKQHFFKNSTIRLKKNPILRQHRYQPFIRTYHEKTQYTTSLPGRTRCSIYLPVLARRLRQAAIQILLIWPDTHAAHLPYRDNDTPIE